MLSQELLSQLAEPREAPCVSIYSPTHDSGSEATGDPIWLKTGLQDAEGILKERGVAKGLIREILEPVKDFQSHLRPNDYGAGTLCAFLSEGFEQILHTPRQVPEGQTFVSERFHLKPLLPTLTDNAHFYVLAISRHDVRLLACTRYTQVEEPLSRQDVPHHILEAIPDVEPKKVLQYHTGKPRGMGRGDNEAMYHGQGKEERMEEHQLFHFFREVSDGIQKYMDKRSPLIFAGVGWLFDHYRKANTYDHLLETPLTGSFERMRPEEIREQAWELIEPYFHQRVAQAQENFAEALAYDKASDNMNAISLAARDGRIATLIGAVDAEYWGRVPELGEDVQMRAEPEPGDYDLIDYAAVRTLLAGGNAFLVESDLVPGEGHGAAAIFRY